MTNFIDTVAFRNIKKMPALFKTDHVNHVVLKEINEAASWVFKEEARATAKVDGTSVTILADGTPYARRMVKKGKVAPNGFILAETDPNTGHQFGLEPMEQSGFHKMFAESIANFEGEILEGTYELVGPRIQGNPENVDKPTLIFHGSNTLPNFPDMRDFADNTAEEIYDALFPIFEKFRDESVEGVVWWGADGKRAKLRVKDFFGDPNRR